MASEHWDGPRTCGMRGFDTGFDPSAASVTDGHDVDALANSHLYIAGRADSDPSIPFPALDPGDPCGDDCGLDQ